MLKIRKNIDIIISKANVAGGSVAGAMNNWGGGNGTIGRDDKRDFPGLNITIE